MITMDAKGITWVGNIYQKFEDMCLEVEEMMYEDTIKYVENQVVTVGESVKKFYSDVIQELLPPSSDNADNIVVSELLAQKYTDVTAFKKSYLNKDSAPSSRLNVKYANSEKRKKDSDLVADVKEDVIPAPVSDRLCKTGNLSSSANAKCMKVKCIDSFQGAPVVKRSIGKKLPPSKTPEKISSTGRDARMVLSSTEELNEGDEMTCNDVRKLSSVEHKRPDFKARSYHEIANANEQIGFVSNSSSQMVACDKTTSEENVSDKLTVPSADFTKESKGFSDQETYCGEFYDLPEIPDAWGFVAQETEAAGGRDDKALLEINKLKLEESCVVVSKDDLHCVSQAGVNSRPYKNKIKRAFSSNRKSARKQEYERLAVLHGKNTSSNQVCPEYTVLTSAVTEPRKSILPETSESEWELL